MPLPTRTAPAAVLLIGLLAGPLAAPAAAQGARGSFSVVEAGIPELRAALAAGRITSRDLVLQYLARIATYEDRINAVIAVNPRALALADSLDAERAAGRLRGPLHGIPVALKDNIHTTDMPTTGGALAFAELIPPYEATLTTNLRAAGAIILAKTVMTELANWMGDAMPGNYSALAGFTMSPYDPRRDPRPATGDGRPVISVGGSSSGVGTAASFWAANVGTETSGSILSPANQNMLVGIKPTVGRISRWGVIPITADQDTPGPMARTVTDAAILLGALEGAEPDPNDPATRACAAPPGRDYTAFLDPDALRGARIGIPRAFYYEPVTPPGESAPRGGLSEEQRRVVEDAIAVLRDAGAVIVDPADVPSVVTRDAAQNLLRWPRCVAPGDRSAACTTTFQYGFKRDFQRWLETLGDRAPVRTLADLRAWNLAQQRAGSMRFGQRALDASDEMDVERDRVRYRVDRARDVTMGGSGGIDAILQRERLDALLFPGSAGANLSARAGYPTVIVPFGRIPNTPTPALPDGFGAAPIPYGVSFAGGACSEPRLIALAYAFEQATERRVPPPGMP